MPYKNPNNYVHYSGRLAERSQDRARRRDLGQPVRQHRQPRGPHRRRRRRRSGRRPTARSTASSPRSARAARWPASATASRPSAGRSRSRSPTRRAPRSTPTTRPASSKAEGSSITEGIGQGRITENLEGAPIDRAYQIPDAEAVPIVLRTARAGRPVPGRLDRRQRRGRHPARQGARARSHDRDDALRYGTRYQSRLFNGSSAVEILAGTAVAGQEPASAAHRIMPNPAPS